MTSMKFDAEHLSRGWLSAAVASNTNKAPVLDRTISVEFHDTGVRLIATDSYMLLHTWIPELDSEEPAPSLDEAPDAAVVAADPDSRGRQFMQYLLARATAKGAPDYETSLTLMRLSETDTGQRMFDQAAPLTVVLELPGEEKILLPVVDAVFPSWRKLSEGFAGKQTTRIALHPDRIVALGKLGKLHDGRAVAWEFGGEVHPARVEVLGADPPVGGLVMPVRWDVDRDMPADDPDPQ